MTNLQINKELIDSMLEQLEKDKILEEYYEFIRGDSNEESNRQTKRMSDNKTYLLSANNCYLVDE